ncbi:imidazole glycerol phosphate synthase subunit HisH [Pseudemcibacter aquimaris]|uniref:imidazole glycerol phosphate synthase subunit HisH n=1 Tax=Pseudemcibacter aquimaris TaxID=2857064 RepID=UPI002011EBF6|nr:imidazole glycerol phosphate synthase subunit HisH [Pseudemcibacter aquimaris]MCC3862258.1 imidazole glycerol phosphate synthase subunit HisH [Pseudemcibacter aquimaris]WDU59009.1 imidazole glycerol phosphate synthase subunit HisH [Pseudemcibacter aquimaris]
MKTVIIDYGSGNLRSAEKSVVRAALDNGIKADISVTSSPDDVKSADRIILPGVGAYADCMAGLSALDGMRDALEESVHAEGKPFLGICVGMQLLSTAGLEYGRTEGLGWIDGDVKEIKVNDPALKVPHMGWNNLELDSDHPVLDGIKSGEHAYFVHSYHFEAADPNSVLAHVDYDGKIAAIVGRDNILGTQFHPEKSQSVGLKLLENFLKWTP